MGLLRGDKNGGTANVGNGVVVIASKDGIRLQVAMEGHEVGGDDHVSINDRKGPVRVAVVSGDYHLMQKFHISAAHVRSILGKAAAAEFAPNPRWTPPGSASPIRSAGPTKKNSAFA